LGFCRQKFRLDNTAPIRTSQDDTTRIGVAAGSEAGRKLVVIEAVKMENILRAEHDYKVKKIDDSLAVDEVIIEFE
jgi:acetyl/propionyl-CoA carboxylase alpha subunit